MTPVEIIDARAGEVPGLVRSHIEGGGRMQMVYAWHPRPGALELRYLGNRRAHEPFVMWRVPVDGEIASVAPIAPLLGWYEREITDLFGLAFAGHPEPHRLVLHEGVAPSTPPMDESFPPGARLSLEPNASARLEVVGADVQRLPWGPVRADVVESAEFDFYYIGEMILHYQPQLFFKHRGIEKRFEGLSIQAATVLAERVSGVGSFAHALAFCQAVEAIAGCEVPERARVLRVILAELERLYNHLHYFGHLAETTTLKVGGAEGKLLEERFKQINARLTGSRFLRGLLKPGGLRRDLAPLPWVTEALAKLRTEIRSYTSGLEHTTSYLDRLMTTGVLSYQAAFDQGATGPVERASGLDRDLRRDHPYAAYGDLSLEVPIREAGDAHARAQVRAAEIDASISLVQRMLLILPDGPVDAACEAVPGGEGLGWAESPRGSLFYAVHFDEAGRLKRVKVKSPSFSNWRVFPVTVHETNMMDYAINEASFGLTIAGCDR